MTDTCSYASSLTTVATVESLILIIALICACCAYLRKSSSESIYRDLGKQEVAAVSPESPFRQSRFFTQKAKRNGRSWEINPVDIKYLNRIGQGNFGEVWRANWLGTIVAVKKVLPVRKGLEFCPEFTINSCSVAFIYRAPAGRWLITRTCI